MILRLYEPTIYYKYNLDILVIYIADKPISINGIRQLLVYYYTVISILS